MNELSTSIIPVVGSPVGELNSPLIQKVDWEQGLSAVVVHEDVDF